MKATNGGGPGTAAGLMVFCLFAASVFALLTLGADAYRSIAGKPREGYEDRACLSYVWTKVKNADGAGRVYMGELGGRPALFLDETLGGRLYRTALYHYDGSLYELFYEDGYEYGPGSGDPVVEAETLLLEELDGGMIRVTAGGRSVCVLPRGAVAPEGGAP